MSAGPSFSPAGHFIIEKPWVLPVAGAAVCLLAGLVAGMSIPSPGSWYQELEKPAGNPPSWVFGPVWTVLYLLMGTSAGLLANRRATPALVAFALQFMLNLLWTPVFFGMRRPDMALIIIMFMWAILLVTFFLAWRSSRIAASLLIPYLAWVGYATYLNAAIYVLNE